MPDPVSFTRLYPHAAGLEHPATPDIISTVLAAMNQAVDDAVPFRIRMADGSLVVVSPKRRRTRP